MNFMQLIKSLDEFLYEMMCWLIFWPVTMWRTLRHPLAMMDYADTELSDSEEEQYTDTLSPPVFLLLSLLISHAIELAMVGDIPMIGDRHGLAALVTDDTSLMLMRLAFFALFPLVMAAHMVRRQKIGLTRATLRLPFYSQCYVAAPFALLVGVATTFGRTHWAWAHAIAAGALPQLIELGLLLIAFAAYGTVQAFWFARLLQVSLLRGFGHATRGMIESLVLWAAISALLF